MTLNLSRQPPPGQYHYFDYFGNPCIKGDVKSYLDSLGRLILMWIAYGFPKDLAEQIEIHLSFEKEYAILYRHPGTWDKTSRDHWSYFIIYRKFRSILHQYPDTGRDFVDFIEQVPKMRGLTTWMDALTGSETAALDYYSINIPGAIIGNVWLRLCRWVGRIREELPNEIWILPCGDSNTGTQMLHHRTRWEKLWGRIISITIPAYALHNKAWQIYVMPDSKKKERLKRILLKRVGKSNLMLRMLFGDTTVTQQEVDNYPHMTGYRPGAYLNTTSRDIRELIKEEAEFNAYEKDLVNWLWIQTA